VTVEEEEESIIEDETNDNESFEEGDCSYTFDIDRYLESPPADIYYLNHTNYDYIQQYNPGKSKELYLHNTMLTKTFLQEIFLTNFLNEDLGITQSNLPLGLNLLIARLTLYPNKKTRSLGIY
jgi:hypothetical protein